MREVLGRTQPTLMMQLQPDSTVGKRGHCNYNNNMGDTNGMLYIHVYIRPSVG